VAAMTRKQIHGIPQEMVDGIAPASCGFGWFMMEEFRFPIHPSLLSYQSYGHSGVSGVYLWIDPLYDLVGVLFFT